jgi:Na+-driven multidrug efflux pump
MDMTTGSLFPKIISFALPLMLTGLLQIVYNAADAVIVGRFSGSLALAAVGATSMLVNLTLNLFLGLSMGSGVVVARHIGANNTASVHRTVHSAMLLSVICGFFIGAVGFDVNSVEVHIQKLC